MIELKDLSRVGLGGCELPLEETLKHIKYGMDNGVNFIDEGWGYEGEHKSETALGAVIKDLDRSKLFINDKFPMFDKLLVKKGFYGDDPNKAMDGILDEQLKCCGVDYFDGYMLHALDDDRYTANPKMDINMYFKILDWMKIKKEEGKIKHIGFSAHINYDRLYYYINEFEKRYGKGFIDIVMLGYNVLNTSPWLKKMFNMNIWDAPGLEGFKLCKEHDITTILMMPHESGRVKQINASPDFLDWCDKFCVNNKYADVILAGTGNKEHLDSFLKKTGLMKDDFVVPDLREMVGANEKACGLNA